MIAQLKLQREFGPNAQVQFVHALCQGAPIHEQRVRGATLVVRKFAPKAQVWLV